MRNNFNSQRAVLQQVTQSFLNGSFTRQCQHLLQQITPTQEQHAQFAETYNRINRKLQVVFGDARLHQFGSVASGMYLRGSGVDMDLCFELNASQLEDLEQERQIQCQKQSDEYIEAVAEYNALELVKSNLQEVVEDSEEDVKLPRQQAPPTLPQVILELLGKHLLKDSSFKDVLILTKTRIPIIKYQDAHTQIKVDIGFENTLAVHNTQMLKAYSQLDQRFLQLVYLLKFWAKRRAVNDTYFGTLSSYAYTLMLIHFLQCGVSPPILPNLQTMSANGQVSADIVKVHTYAAQFIHEEPRKWQQLITQRQYDVYYCKEPVRPKQVNTQTLGSLFFGFFNYFAFEFDFKNDVASIRAGGILTKEEKDWVPEVHKPQDDEDASTQVAETQKTDAKKQHQQQRFWICIEDPFEITHNLGRPVGRDSLYFIRGEFLRASSLITAPKNYSREYVASVLRGQEYDHLAPHLLAELVAETQYKTRDDHKSRNKQNMERKQKRDKQQQQTTDQ